jgi:hypothetical protein
MNEPTQTNAVTATSAEVRAALDSAGSVPITPVEQRLPDLEAKLVASIGGGSEEHGVVPASLLPTGDVLPVRGLGSRQLRRPASSPSSRWWQGCGRPTTTASSSQQPNRSRSFCRTAQPSMGRQGVCCRKVHASTSTD